MRKICFITTISSTLKSFVLPTAEMLYKTGNYEIAFICNNDEKFAKELPQHIRYIPIKINRGISFDGFKVVRQLRKIFKKEKFDIVQYSTPNAAFYSSIAAKKEGVPIRLYGQWGFRYVGLNGLKRKIFKFIEKTTCKKSTIIWSVSNKNRMFGISEKLYNENKVHVIGKGGTVGVDLSDYNLSCKNNFRLETRNKYGLSESFVFCFVGRLSFDKGAKELFYAFEKINKQYNSKLLIVGRSELANSSVLINGDMKDSVVFSGELAKEDVCKCLAASDVLVHPTYREGFGMVLQEAGAMETAIITTDIPGASEVFENGKSCLLVPAKDGESLYLAMKRLCDNPELTKEIAHNARIKTETDYKRESMLKNQLAFYESLEDKKC